MPARTPKAMATITPTGTYVPSACACSISLHSFEDPVSSVKTVAGSDGELQPPVPPVSTRNWCGVPAMRSVAVHSCSLYTFSHPSTFHQLTPPSVLFCTRYSAALAACSVTPGQVSPLVDAYGEPPDGCQVTLTSPLDPPPITTAATSTGGCGATWPASSTSSLAFCARLEKLLLRDDMYLYVPALNLTSPRSTVASAALSFSQFCRCWSLLTSPAVRQPVCFERANCLVSFAMSRGPACGPDCSGFHSYLTLNIDAPAAGMSIGTSMPELSICTMLCRSSSLVPSPLLLPLLLVLSLPVHCTCT